MKEIPDTPPLQHKQHKLNNDKMYYQQLLNQYLNHIYYETNFVEEKDLRYFNKDDQNALVQEFIDSEILNEIDPTMPVLSRFAHFDDAGRENIARDRPYNFIFTTGVGSNMNQRGTHYVAGQIFRDPITNELVVLHYDSLNGTMSDEFERYIRKEFGKNIQIVNISNNDKTLKQQQGTNTCGLYALTALRTGGILDQERVRTIREYHMSQDTNFNMRNTPQQTLIQPQLSENFRGLIDIKTDNTPQRQQNQPSLQTQRTLPPPPPSRSSTPSMGGGND